MQTLRMPITPSQNEPANKVISDADILGTGEGAKANILQPLNPGAGNNTGYQKTTVSAGNLVDGKMCAEWVDMIVPGVIVFVAAKAGKLFKKSELQMTEKEKTTLAPVLSACLDSLMINFDSPWVALAVTAGFMYTGKIMNATAEKMPAKQAAKAENEKKKEDKPPERKSEGMQSIDLARERATRLRQQANQWMPTEEEIEEKGRELKQSPKHPVGRAKIITSMRNIRYKQLLNTPE